MEMANVERNEHDFLIELERLKAEFAHQRGWDTDEDGDPNPYWWEDDEKLYAAECYAYEILEKDGYWKYTTMKNFNELRKEGKV